MRKKCTYKIFQTRNKVDVPKSRRVRDVSSVSSLGMLPVRRFAADKYWKRKVRKKQTICILNAGRAEEFDRTNFETRYRRQLS
jgi:hypothetical protein